MIGILVFKMVLGVAMQLPPADLATPMQRLARIDAEILGRDPCEGTGLCCALNPVFGPKDVDAIVLPKIGTEVVHLRLLREFPNLRRVRVQRYISEEERKILQESVTKDTLIAATVRKSDGSFELLQRRKRRTYLIDPVTGEPIKDVPGLADDASAEPMNKSLSDVPPP
jgi:hypothetical protein